MGCCSPGSSVHGILQARLLEWVAMSSSRGSSQPRDQTHISYVSCMGRQLLYPTLKIFSLNPGPNLPSIYITNGSKDPTLCLSIHFSCIWLWDPRTAACQAFLSITNSQSLLKFMSTESVMPSNHLILCCPFLLHLQSFPASESFQMGQLFTSGGQSIGVLASTSVLPMNTQDWSPLG